MRRFLPVVFLLACQEYTLTPDKDDDDELPIDSDPAIDIGQPDIEVSPAELRFGGLPPGCAADEQVVKIQNVGDARLDVSSAELLGAGSDAFTLSDPGPWKLAPGESVKVRVGFTPDDYMVFDRVRVEVTSNDPDEDVVKVPAFGEGSDAVFREEMFEQGLASSVDVLWIIDTSESMVDEQQELGREINTFIQSFVNLGLDFRLAITSTDVSSTGLNGTFAGPWMDDSTPNLVAEFQDQANLGALGSADEKGFAATKKALTAPRTQSAPNQGFLRPDANLAVVVVSDEDDRDATSELGGQMNQAVVNDFVTWLKALKAPPHDVTFSAMSGPATGGLSACGSLASQASSSPAYNKAVRDTYGVWSNICNFDITPFLTHLSFVAAGLEFRFELSDDPISFSPSAITVVVDGQTIPYGALNGWTYDQTTNAVELHGTAIPDPGETTVITYPVEGDCQP